MSFSATEGAFEGFRLTRRHPLGVLAWAGVMLAATLLSGMAIGMIAGPSWAEFEAIAAVSPVDAAQLMPLLPKVVPAALISMLLQVVGAAAVNTSVLRGLLRPEGRITVGFGRDELRVVGLLVAFFGVSFLATVVLGVIMGLLGPQPEGRTEVISTLVGIATTLFLYIRFSLAGPMTIAEHRYRFWASWKATRGHGWALLGSQIIAAMLALIVVILANFIFLSIAGVGVLLSGGQLADLATMFSPDFSGPASLLRPLPLVYVAFFSVLYAIALAVLAGPPIELYRSLKRDGKLG